MKPIAAVLLPEARMPFTDSAAAANPPAMPAHMPHGASGRELSFGRSSLMLATLTPALSRGERESYFRLPPLDFRLKKENAPGTRVRGALCVRHAGLAPVELF